MVGSVGLLLASVEAGVLVGVVLGCRFGDARRGRFVMMSARWLRRSSVLVAVVVLAAACGGEPEPAVESSGAAPETAGAVESEPGEVSPGSDGGLEPESVLSSGLVGGVSESGLDLERLAAAVATLDADAVCPELVLPASFMDVVEVGRIAEGCAVIEYVALGGARYWGGARRVGGGSDGVRGGVAGDGFTAGGAADGF